MRLKLLFAAAFTAACAFASAQSLPNAQFENWGTDIDGTDSLLGWSSNHDAYQGSVPQWLYKNTSPYSGNYAANINSVGFGFTQQPINGVLANGKADIRNEIIDHYYRGGGGSPVAGKPTSLDGYYRYIGQGDHGMASVVLFKYNSSTGMRDTVGKGSMLFTPASTWTPFTITINDLMPSVIPDSILTVFWASDTANPSPYRELYLDQFVLNTPTSVEEIENIVSSVFPNPAGNEAWIRFESFKTGEAKLELFNTQGQLIRTIVEDIQTGVHHTRIDLSTLSSGLYYYSLTLPGSSGGGKIIKE
jgi:hypothetical protein